MIELAARLFPLPRSLTGHGVRRTLAAIADWVPLDTVEVPSGTPVYDWVVPPEWNVAEAWIADESGNRLVDFADSSLHVVGYSEPVRANLTGAELDSRLHSLPDRPALTPYRTSYYTRTWGFCLPDAIRRRIEAERTYEVVIDATLDDGGSLTYGECFVPGTGASEILVSTYVCHPATANDNVAGIVVAAALARALRPNVLEHGVRFVFAPSGVGTLAWLQRNEERLDRIDAGLVVACAGDDAPLSYKRSRRGDTVVDRAAAHVLGHRPGSIVRDFVPWGTDERQFCSPGFNLPVGTLTRTPNGLYEAYHTSADDLSVISAARLADTLSALAEIVHVVDGNARLVRTEPRGEPHLSGHGIDGTMSGGLLSGRDDANQALFWLLNLADGEHDLLEVAERAEVPFAMIEHAARVLSEAGVLRPE
jgi:aminopeptidase-like protein